MVHYTSLSRYINPNNKKIKQARSSVDVRAIESKKGGVKKPLKSLIQLADYDPFSVKITSLVTILSTFTRRRRSKHPENNFPP